MRRDYLYQQKQSDSPKPFFYILLGGGIVAGIFGLFHLFAKNDKQQTNIVKKRIIVPQKSAQAKQDNPPTKTTNVPPTTNKPSVANTNSSPSVAPKKTKETSQIQLLAGIVKGALPHTFRHYVEKEKGDLLAALVARLLIWRLHLRRDLRKGDEFKILYKAVNEQSKYKILAMSYKSQKHSRTFKFYHFKESHRKYSSYFNEHGKEHQLFLRNSPLKEYEQVTSILKMRPKHKGVDFKAPQGTPIYLPWRGKVLRKTWNFRYNGNCLSISFFGKKRRIKAMFLHMDKIAKNIRPGKIYAAGTYLGTVGNTGRSTAPHLHYQLQAVRGRRIYDPYKTHQTYERHISSSSKSAFQLAIAKFDQLFIDKAKLD